MPFRSEILGSYFPEPDTEPSAQEVTVTVHSIPFDEYHPRPQNVPRYSVADMEHGLRTEFEQSREQQNHTTEFTLFVREEK